MAIVYVSSVHRVDMKLGVVSASSHSSQVAAPEVSEDALKRNDGFRNSISGAVVNSEIARGLCNHWTGLLSGIICGKLLSLNREQNKYNDFTFCF